MTTWSIAPMILRRLQVYQGAWSLAPRQRIEVSRRGSVAIIPIVGAIGTSAGPSVSAIRDAIRGAVRRGARGIVLDVDSPGGTVAGVPELADEVEAIRKRGTAVVALIERAAGSAYWIASAANRVLAVKGAEVGGIGVATVMRDTHRAYEAKGIDTHVVASGSHKGAGVAGSRLTLDHLAAEQQRVDAIGGLFFDAVRRARNLDDAGLARVTDGRTWIAAQAQALGLVDGVTTRDRAIALASRS